MTEVVVDVESRLAILEADNKKLKTDLKKLQKQFRKLTKEPEDPGNPKKPSGFAKPMKLSDALYTFLDVPAGTMLARTDVTKMINTYVKAQNLQNPENKREIILDDKLRTIITPNEGDVVTFFNLQKYMSPHYIKEVAVVDVIPEEPIAEVASVETVEKKPVVKKIVKKVVKKI